MRLLGAERIDMHALEDVAETVREIAKRDREIERLRGELLRVQAYIDETPDLFAALEPLRIMPPN